MKLALVLNDANHEFRPGEVVEGVLEVDCSAHPESGPDVRCHGIRVFLAWYTHGKGNGDTGEVDAVDVQGEGELAAGKVHRLPFRVTLPSLPVPYDGEIVNVAYRLGACADVPWAVDPKATTELAVQGANADSSLSIRHNWKKKESGAAGPIGCGLLGLCMSGTCAAAGGLSSVESGQAVVLGALASIVALCWGLSVVLRERKIGLVDLEIEHVKGRSYRDQRGLGRLAVALLIPRTVAGLRACATLCVEEHAVRGSGSNKNTFNHVLYQQDSDLGPTHPGRFEASLDLPEEGAVPHSFYATSNSIRWHLQVKLDVPGAVDWSETVRIDTAGDA